MSTSLPTTLTECFVWLSHNLSAKQLADLESLDREDLWQTHFWLTPIIRDNLLHENLALNKRLEHTAFCDDPDLAGQIGNAFWDHLQIVKAQSEKG